MRNGPVHCFAPAAPAPPSHRGLRSGLHHRFSLPEEAYSGFFLYHHRLEPDRPCDFPKFRLPSMPRWGCFWMKSVRLAQVTAGPALGLWGSHFQVSNCSLTSFISRRTVSQCEPIIRLSRHHRRRTTMTRKMTTRARRPEARSTTENKVSSPHAVSLDHHRRRPHCLGITNDRGYSCC
jgi:hypothetical protein